MATATQAIPIDQNVASYVADETELLREKAMAELERIEGRMRRRG